MYYSITVQLEFFFMDHLESLITVICGSPCPFKLGKHWLITAGYNLVFSFIIDV